MYSSYDVFELFVGITNLNAIQIKTALTQRRK